MPIERWKFITRDMVRAAPDTLFVFGDNWAGTGYGGQAREMRGEPNAVGLATKKAPSNDPGAFLTDADYEDAVSRMEAPLNRLELHIMAGGKVVIPLDGIGTGLAQLNERAPRIAQYLAHRLDSLEILVDAAPWDRFRKD